MGVNLDDAKLLARMASQGTRFGHVLTLGRQQLFFAPSDLAPALRGMDFPEATVEAFIRDASDGGLIDPLLRLCGASEVTSLDYSDYQGASIQHDLNHPIPAELHGRYDLVLDGGTLEHVFHFPVGLRNAMEMAKVGGSLVVLTIANNQVGHGFYQFSPELFYRAFSEANGYEIRDLRAIELSPAHRIYDVRDPAVVRSRVTLSGVWPVNLFVHAVRREKREIFAASPQQSDYVELWKAPEASGSACVPAHASWKRSLVRAFPGLVYGIATFKRVFLETGLGLRNAKFFRELRE